MTKARMGKVFASVAAAMAAGVLTSSAMALPIFGGANTLSDGPARGLDENYIAVAGVKDYVAPNGAVASANVFAGAFGQAIGMTESLRRDFSAVPGGRSSGLSLAGPIVFPDGRQGINIPQPQLLTGPGADPRAAVANSLFGGLPVWGARTGAVSMFTLNTPSLGLGAVMAPGTVTAQVFNLTPGNVLANPIAGLVDDGLAPGSVAGDGIADFAPFVQFFPGSARQASFTLNLLGDDTQSQLFFGGPLPAPMIPRLRLYEGGLVTPENSPPLDEANFNHSGGNDLTGAGAGPGGPFAAPTGALGAEIDKVVDGALLLGGVLDSINATLTWTETGPSTGEFYLDVLVQGRITYDEGSLFGVLTDSNGSFSASWTSMAFTRSTDGITDATIGGVGIDGVTVNVSGVAPGAVVAGGWDFLYNNLPYASDYDFDVSGATTRFPKPGSGSVDLSFSTGIPEPMTGGLALLAAGALAGYISRRRPA